MIEKESEKLRLCIEEENQKHFIEVFKSCFIPAGNLYYPFSDFFAHYPGDIKLLGRKKT